MPSALKMGSKRKQISLCLLLCILVLNLGVDSKPLKQRDGYSHGTHLEDIEDIGKSHRGDGWTKNFKPHSKYMPVIDLIKEKMEKCKTYPNDKLCGPGRTKYLPNLADEDNDVLSFDMKDEVSANYILRSAELYLNVVTSNQDLNLSDVTTPTDRMTLSYDTKQILRLSSGSENRSENSFRIELDVTDETILFLEAGISDRFNFTADVAGHHLSAFLILKLERILSGRPLVFDLLWPPKNVSRIADNGHQHHGSRSRRLVSKVTSRRMCRKHKVRVDFRELGYDWIISPHGFETSLCMGVCPFPLDSYLNATVHSTIQGFLNARDAPVEGARVPRPCVHDAMSPIPLIIWDEEGDLTLAFYSEMVVESCGCR